MWALIAVDRGNGPTVWLFDSKVAAQQKYIEHTGGDQEEYESDPDWWIVATEPMEEV